MFASKKTSRAVKFVANIRIYRFVICIPLQVFSVSYKQKMTSFYVEIYGKNLRLYLQIPNLRIRKVLRRWPPTW